LKTRGMSGFTMHFDDDNGLQPNKKQRKQLLNS
jgi:hypothetical protein